MTEQEKLILLRLADRQAIRDCVTAYCRGVDRLDRDLLLSAYHPDAIDDHGVVVMSPVYFAGWAFDWHSSKHHTTQHIITNHSCELQGDVAHTETYWMLAAMNKDTAPALSLSGGRYIDRLEKRDGKWKIAARKCVVDWHGVPGAGVVPPAMREALNFSGPPTRDRSDPSYERPLSVAQSRIGFRFVP